MGDETQTSKEESAPWRNRERGGLTQIRGPGGMCGSSTPGGSVIGSHKISPHSPRPTDETKEEARLGRTSKHSCPAENPDGGELASERAFRNAPWN